MAIDWGAYEANSGRGIRVGVEIVVGSVGHGSDHVNFTINYYTQNSGGGWNGRNDAQTLNLSLDFVGSINFTNNEGLGIQLRGSRSDVHNYAANSYGNSPGSKSYKALLGGADNGVTPGSTSSVTIPARPIAAPAAVFWPSANYVADDRIDVQWLNQSTVGEPYDGIQLWASADNGASYGLVTTVTNILPPSQATVASHLGLSPNQKWVYLIRPYNGAGYIDSITNYQWTSPGQPTAPTRTVSGTVDQVVAWTNSCSYPEYQTEVWRCVDGVWSNWRTVAAGVTSTTDTGTDPTRKYKYRVRSSNTSTSLYSAFTAETTETTGVVSAPAAPTGLSPDSVSLKYDATIATVFRWTHNPTDGYPQSKYEIQYRVAGTTPWISLGPQTSTGQQATVPANTFVPSKSYEWQVRTWAVSSIAGAWSATATFNTDDPIPVRYPLYLNTTTGQVEADSTGAGPGTTPGGLILSFGAAATSWLGVHTFNQTPVDVTLMDTGGNEIYGNISYPSPNQVQATFQLPIAGSMLIQK